MRTSLLLIAALAVPSIASATPTTNGIYVNTGTLNGIYVNGRELSNGYLTAAVFGDETIDGVKPNWQAYKDGFYLYYPHLAGTELAGWTWEWAVGGWVWRTGDWFEGTMMPAGVYNADSGKTESVALKIADISRPTGVEMPLYWMQVLSTDASGVQTWQPLCHRPGETPVPAIALRGEWNLQEYVAAGGDQISDSPYRVTFACVSGALGKCAASCSDVRSMFGWLFPAEQVCAAAGIPAALGYKRWLPAGNYVEGDLLLWRDYALDHQACTRMVRADYCGNGHAWTANGTPIDVYDRTYINESVMHTESSWMYEATWNENGAVRIQCDRLYEQPVSCSSGGDAPWVSLATAPLQFCYTGDGLHDTRARLGNLRQRNIALPLPLPYSPLRL